MRIRETFQLVLAGFFIVLGVYGLLTGPPQGLMTGYILYNGSSTELQVVNPTPADGATINQPNLWINVSPSTNMSNVFIEWQGVNQTMNQSGSNYHVHITQAGHYNYTIHANTSSDHTLILPKREVKYGYVNLTALTNQDILEDASATQIPITVSSNTALSSLTYNLTFDNANLVCSVNTTAVQCAPKANITGRTNVSLKIKDGPITKEDSMVINVTAVNDLPYMETTISELKVPRHKNASIRPKDYIKDLETEDLTFIGINGSKATAYMRDTKLWITPIETGDGVVNFTASDGETNVTFGFLINVTPNSAPEVLTLTSLINWTENSVGSVRLTTLFTDPNGDSLTYNITEVSGISISISASSAFFVPEVGLTGTFPITVTATDGEHQVSTTLTLRIDPLNGAPAPAAPAPVVPDPTPAPVVPTSTPFAPQIFQEEGTHTVDVGSFVDMSTLSQDTLAVTVSGLNSVTAQIQGTQVTFTPDANFFGEETANIQITDGTTSYEGSMLLTITNVQDELKQMVNLPKLFLNENKNSTELNLATYFQDPDGADLEFEIDAPEGVDVEFKSKSVVVFSLAEGYSSANTSARIVAKASNGRSLTSNIAVNLVEAVKTDSEWYRLFLQVLIVTLLLGIIGFGGVQYQRQSKTRKTRLTHINKTIEDVYKDPEMQRSLKSQAMQHSQVQKPQERAWITVQKSMKTLYKELFTKEPEQPKPEVLKEPDILRSELLYMKETISSLRAITSSSQDKLVTAALRAEKDKLMRAYHSARGKEEVNRDLMRRLLLYAMESSSALQEIAAVCEDTLITFEVRKQARRMKKVMQSLMYKLDDHYEKDPLSVR